MTPGWRRAETWWAAELALALGLSPDDGHDMAELIEAVRVQSNQVRLAQADAQNKRIRRPRQHRRGELRWPWPPLAKAAGFKDGLRVTARRLGADCATLNRWAVAGVPDCRADELAGRLGCHPTEIWPEWGQAYEAELAS